MKKRINHKKLKLFISEVLKKAGLDEYSRRSVATGLYEASIRGVDSHGVRLLSHYVNSALKGRKNPKPHYKFKRPFPALGVLNADNAFGHAAGMKAIDFCIKIAKKNLDEKIQKEAEKTLNKKVDPGPGIPVGVDRTPPKYGSMLNAKGIKKQEDDYHRLKAYQWNYRTGVKFYDDTNTPDFGSRSSSTFFGNFGQSLREEKGSVEIDTRNFTPDDQEPEFRNKVEENIWRLKNKK